MVVLFSQVVSRKPYKNPASSRASKTEGVILLVAWKGHEAQVPRERVVVAVQSIGKEWEPLSCRERGWLKARGLGRSGWRCPRRPLAWY